MRARALPALLLLAAGCGRDKLAPSEPQQRIEGLKMSQSNSGSPSWELASEYASLIEGDKMAQLKEPRLSFYKKNKRVSTLEARSGLLRTDTQDVVLSSGVVVVSLEDQTRLETEQLIYSSEKKKFYTEQAVLVKRPGGRLRGKGMEASPDLTDIRIFNQRTEIEKAPR